MSATPTQREVARSSCLGVLRLGCLSPASNVCLLRCPSRRLLFDKACAAMKRRMADPSAKAQLLTLLVGDRTLTLTGPQLPNPLLATPT